jgi:hypothetical protein
MMHQDYSAVTGSLNKSKAAKNRSDFACLIFIDSMETDEWIEDKKAGREFLHSITQKIEFLRDIEAKRGSSNHKDLERRERHSRSVSDCREPGSNYFESIFSGKKENRAGMLYLESLQAWDSSCNSHRKRQRKCGFAAFWLSPYNPDCFIRPELLDQPFLLRGFFRKKVC